MKYILLFLLFLTACDNAQYTVKGDYYPSEYISYLNVGNNSSLNPDSTNVTSGIKSFFNLILKDTNDNYIIDSRVKIDLVQSGSGSINIESIQDNNDGSYQIFYTPIKKGIVNLKLKANEKELNILSSIEVFPNDIDVNKSTAFITQTKFLVGDVAEVVLTLRDMNGNQIFNNTLDLHSTIADGTSQASVSTYTYDSGKYYATITALQEGTPSTLNISIKDKGIVTSDIPVSVASIKEDYSDSSLVLSRSDLKAGETTQIKIYIKDESSNILDENIPVVLETYGGTSQIEFSDPIKVSNYIVSTVKAISSGSEIKIRAKVNNEYINVSNEKSFRVYP